MRQMFNPVVNKIVALLQSQLDAERKQAGHVSIKARAITVPSLNFANDFPRLSFWSEASATLPTSTKSFELGARSKASVCSVLRTREPHS